MAAVSLTVRQIMNLGLWDKVCEYKGWDTWILNEGRIDENEVVEFDDTFKNHEEVKSIEEHVYALASNTGDGDQILWSEGVCKTEEEAVELWENYLRYSSNWVQAIKINK